MKKKFKNKYRLILRHKIYLFLLVIILFGGWLRFWQLIDYPIHLTIDEVAIGYNAFSILETARDEHGAFLPLAFKSTGDWKPPAVFYLDTLSILIFGMNEFGVRFPIALIGSLTPLLGFLIVRKLTKNDLLAILTALSLAISPWHIQYSRISHDSVLGLFFILLGIWLFLKAIEERRKLFPLAALALVLSMYSCHTERLFTPLLVLGLAFIYRQKIWARKKEAVIAFALGFLLLIPLVLMMLGPQGQRRAQMTFISQDVEISRELHSAGEELSLIEKVLDNNFLILGNFWLKRYFNYWDPAFLFFKGMRLTLPHTPDVGLFHLFELPFFLLGLGLLFFKRKTFSQETKSVVILFLLLGPLAASLANNDQHTSRSLTTSPALHLLVGLGLFYFFKKFILGHFRRMIAFSLAMGGVVLLSLFYYFDLYYLHYPLQFSEYYHYGFKELSLYAWEQQDKYKEIVVDYHFGSEGPFITGVPHLYLLFYGQYEPRLYQQRPDLELNDFADFSFRPIYWPDDRHLEKTLFIGSPWSLPLKDIKEEQILKKIYFKNGELGFLVVKSEN